MASLSQLTLGVMDTLTRQARARDEYEAREREAMRAMPMAEAVRILQSEGIRQRSRAVERRGSRAMRDWGIKPA